MGQRSAVLFVSLALGLGTAAPAIAQTDFSGTATAELVGFDEVPSVFSFGSGAFEATVDSAGTSIVWDLTYDHLRGNATQAHIHFAEEHVNGGIVVFFCSNLGNAPPGTPACPETSGHLTGTFHAADVVSGAQGQGIAGSQLKALLWSMRRGATYVNLHTDEFPGGEIRGQVHFMAFLDATVCCQSRCSEEFAGTHHPRSGVKDIIYRNCTGGHSGSCPGSTVKAPCSGPNLNCDADGEYICPDDPQEPGERFDLC